MEKFNEKQVKKLSENVQQLMSDLFAHMQLFEKDSRKLRIRISKQLKDLTRGISKEERQALHKMIVGFVQQGFAESRTNARAAARGVSVGVSRGCVGNEGGGVVASDGSFSVKVCAMGSLSDGITGGGVEGGWSY